MVLDDHMLEEIASTSVISKHMENNNINLLFYAFTAVISRVILQTHL